jgi:hypothetical protein
VAWLQGLAAQLEEDLAAAAVAPGGGGPAARPTGAGDAAAAGDVLAAAAGEPPGCAACCTLAHRARTCTWICPARASSKLSASSMCQAAALPGLEHLVTLHLQQWPQDACAVGGTVSRFCLQFRRCQACSVLLPHSRARVPQ